MSIDELNKKGRNWAKRPFFMSQGHHLQPSIAAGRGSKKILSFRHHPAHHHRHEWSYIESGNPANA